jgi:hypothetical protein
MSPRKGKITNGKDLEGGSRKVSLLSGICLEAREATKKSVRMAQQIADSVADSVAHEVHLMR